MRRASKAKQSRERSKNAYEVFSGHIPFTVFVNSKRTIQLEKKGTKEGEE
jgi:hypothetical protein